MGKKDFPGQWKNHSIVRDIDKAGFVITVDGGRIGPDVDPANISDQALIKGNSLIQGKETIIKAGAVIEDSYGMDVIIEGNTNVIDSVLISTDNPNSHKCDGAGKYVVEATKVHITAGAKIEHSHIENVYVGENSLVSYSTIVDSRIGPANEIKRAKVTLTSTEKAVKLDGFTEFSEAWLGRGTCVDKQGYFEGVFSSEFAVLDFDKKTGKLSVSDVMDVPHVSLYGTNTINSTNSGRLLPQPDGMMKNFGPQVALWHDRLLSHEHILLGPSIWVNSWTKIVAGAANVYQNEVDKVKDPLHTYLMPLSASGYGGDSTIGLVPCGEKSNGYGHKTHDGAWVFTHCPSAVIGMVGRLYDVLDEEEKSTADIFVKTCLNNAFCLSKYNAQQLRLDLSKPRDKQRGGRAKWYWDYHKLLNAHIEADIWNFKDGRPVGWERRGGKWRHEKLDAILKMGITSDAELNLTQEKLLEDLNPEHHQKVHLENAISGDELVETIKGKGHIDPRAQISSGAIVDPTAKIGPNVKVENKAYIGPGTVLKGNTIVGQGAKLYRTIVENTTVGQGSNLLRSVVSGSRKKPSIIGKNVQLVGCKVVSSAIGDNSQGCDSKIINSSLAEQSTVSPFAVADNVKAGKPAIIGGPMVNCTIDTVLMSMHTAGMAKGMRAVSIMVEAQGRKIKIPAIPMLGGGCQIHGDSRDAAVIEGSFIGSNAVVAAGSFVGVGSFVLGYLGSEEGLLPFTVSHQSGTERDEIGAVLSRFSNMIITHTIGWTYQALPKKRAGDVVHMIKGAIKGGIAAIKAEQQRREKGLTWEPEAAFGKYKSMPLYSDEQLAEGLRIYEENLEQGSWDLIFDGNELRFANAKGYWAEKNGHVRWQKH